MAVPSPSRKSWFSNSDHLRSVGRTVGLAAAVGIVAGLGAVVLQSMCAYVSHYAMDAIMGYQQGGPAHEASLFDSPTADLIPWLIVAIPTLGGLVSGWLVFRYAPEAEGHGTDSAIDAYHNNGGNIRPRIPLIKALASAITLGTGGSGGREGPIAQIGAGFGSYFGQKLRLSPSERRVLMAAGLGAGIGAIFHAPLAGAIFSVEVLYRDPEFESEALIPSFIATTVAYCVYQIAMHHWMGLEAYHPLFHVEEIHFRNPLLLMPLTALVLVITAASFLYVKCFYSIRGVFLRMNLRRWLKPAVGAFLTGCVALILYLIARATVEDARFDVLSVLSFGYGFLQKILGFNGELPWSIGATILVLLMVAFGKMLTTALTIGSGGSGGVFGPSMVIGGALGAVVGLLFQAWLPGVIENRIDVFVILGMAGFFAAAANTPVSTLIMVSEMTASYELLLPAMWVCAISYLLSHGWSIYRKQVNMRQDSAAHRGEFMIDVLEGMRVRDVITSIHTNFITVLPGMRLKDVMHLFTDTKQNCFPVVGRDGKYFGLFSLSDVRQFLHASELAELAVAHDLAIKTRSLHTNMDLNAAVERFAARPFEELPVTDPADPNQIIAMLRREDLIAAYNSKLIEIRKQVAEKPEPDDQII
jgi:CIC family chloride channel protein